MKEEVKDKGVVCVNNKRRRTKKRFREFRASILAVHSNCKN